MIQGPSDPLAGVTIPESRLGRINQTIGGERGLGGLDDPARIGPDHPVGAFFDRDRPLGVLPEGETRHPEDRGFLLDPAAVGQHHGGVGLETEEVEVALRFHQRDARREVESFKILPSPWVHREKQWALVRDLAQRPDQPVEHDRIVDVRRPVERHEAVATRHVTSCGPSRAGSFEVGQQGVDHDVADEHHPPRIAPFIEEIVDGVRAGGQQQIAHPVGDHAVHLLGHRPVTTTQSGFDMGDEEPGLGTDQCAGDRRIDVADDHDDVVSTAPAQILERLHDATRLLRVAAGTHLEVVVGRSYAQVDEKDIAHGCVVVLTGMDQLGLMTRCFEGVDDRLDLHEVWPSPGNAGDPAHASPASLGGSESGTRRPS